MHEPKAKVDYARKMQGAFVLIWLIVMAQIFFAPHVEIQEWIFGITIVLMMGFTVALLLIRCGGCGANLFFRKGFWLITLGMKWMPLWFLPISKSCDICGMVRAKSV